jgi:putative membrane protein
MKKTILSAALCIALVLTAIPAQAAPQKDESVYAALDYDGSVRSVELVSRYTELQAGKPITDYGAFTNVRNLTTDHMPVVEEDRITWDLGSEPPAEFYYQASLDKAIPYTVALRYTLDGQPVPGDTLAGKTGRITIEINIKPNPACDESLREGIMVQASISLDSAKCRNIQADGATLVVMGGYINLSYTVLPEQEAAYTLSMDAEDFAMQGITFNLIPYGDMLGDFREDAEALTDGFDTMADAMDGMIDGTGRLRDGLSDLTDGIGELDTGLTDLSEGAADFAAGLGDFGGGLGGLRRGLSQLSDGSRQIKSALRNIEGGGAPLLQGYTGAAQGLETLKQQHDTLLGAANYLLSTVPDPTDTSNPLVSLCLFFIGESTALEDTISGISDLNTALSGYMDGVSALAGQYDAFHSGIAGLPRQVQTMRDGFDKLQNGFADIQSGIGALSDGVRTMHTETARLPKDVQALIDGQTEFRDGILAAKDEAKDKIDGLFPENTGSPVSFADGRSTVHSVQYMLKTPDIERKKASAPDLEGKGERKGFIQRLIALFR